MNEQEAKKKSTTKSRQKKKKRNGPYPFEFRVRTVRMHLEEGYPASLITSEMGISKETLNQWTKRYQQYGEAGLKNLRRGSKRTRLPGSVKDKIIQLKRSNPGFGSRRIADMLKRFFLMPASSSTVHTTLSQEQLTTKQKQKPKKNPGKPRFFERSTPNQLWQSDICTFRLGGQNAYLIGFMDDYSRYMTGLGLYRSQTAENVLEVYRRAIGEYGVCKEMLTDNGRQYTNWRGSTRFEQELKKERVRHIRSRPHHPMTLGKMERFWKTILEEFLLRAQFGSFEEARERIRLWVQYYNHQRPHQGIGGLCPADRFFEIHHELKKTLEKGMEENVLELALRGKPRDPFYMVGRMGEQSVVIRAEKGQVRMLVDGEAQKDVKELVYELKKEDSDHEEEAKQAVIQPGGEGQNCAFAVERPAVCIGTVPGEGDQLDTAGPLAEPGHGGDGEGVNAGEQGEAACSERETGEAAGEEGSKEKWCGEAGGTAQDHPEAEDPGDPLMTVETHGEKGQDDKKAGEGRAEPGGPAAGRDHHEGTLRTDDGYPGSAAAGGSPEDLLQVGATRSGGPAGGGTGSAKRPA
jgi:transposase InsO family protein/transposase-like protein